MQCSSFSSAIFGRSEVRAGRYRGIRPFPVPEQFDDIVKPGNRFLLDVLKDDVFKLAGHCADLVLA
jgi:hypothetical protein